jgi:hypothetical protein
MNLYELLSDIRDGIAHDGELRAWAVSQFDKGIKVFVGMPADGFPSMDDDAPFVALVDPEDARSQTTTAKRYSFGGWVGLVNSGRVVNPSDNIVELEGVGQISDAIELVRDAIAGAIPSNIRIELFETYSITLGVGDEIDGYFNCTLSGQDEFVIGRDPLA